MLEMEDDDPSQWSRHLVPIPQGENLQKGRDDLIHFKKRRIWKTAFSFL